MSIVFGFASGIFMMMAFLLPDTSWKLCGFFSLLYFFGGLYIDWYEKDLVKYWAIKEYREENNNE